MPEPPVFILGAPRSGTTLLYKSLALHPDAAWINNYQRRLPRLPALAGLNRVPGRATQTRQRVWFGAAGDNAYRYASARSSLERWFPQPVEGEPQFRLRGIPEVSDRVHPTDQQRQLRRDFDRMVQASGARVVLSKRIGHNTRVPLLHGIFPEARFISLTRDGRAVAASLVRVDWWQDGPLWWYGGTPRQWEGNGGNPLELAARHWVEETKAIDAGLAGVDGDQVLRLRYEDLVEQPGSILGSAAEFAGLRPSRAWREALSGVRFAGPDKAWRDALGENAEMVTAIEGEQLAALGYAS